MKTSKIDAYSNVEELNIYFNEINKIPSLKRDEERELIKRIQQGDEDAMNRLVTHNLKFVVTIAKNYRNRGVSFVDLISEGNMGLFKAAKKFNLDMNVKFITYAVHWVKNEILTLISNCNTDKELITDEYTVNSCQDSQYDSSLINEEFEEELNNIQSRQGGIDELTKCLKERELKIIELYYGLNNNKEMTLDEVGAEMNLTIERVRQIKDKAMMKLRCEALSWNHDEIETLKSLR